MAMGGRLGTTEEFDAIRAGKVPGKTLDWTSPASPPAKPREHCGGTRWSPVDRDDRPYPDGALACTGCGRTRLPEVA